MKLAFNGCNAPSFTSSEAYNSSYYSALGISPSPGRTGHRRSSTTSSRSSSAAARRDGTRALSAARQQLSRLTLSYERLSTQHNSGIKSVVRHTSPRKLSRSDSPRNSSSSGGAASAKKIGAEEVGWARWRWLNYWNRGLRQLVKNEKTSKKPTNQTKKYQSSSFNSGNTLNRDQQCSGLILEGNILHVSQVQAAVPAPLCYCSSGGDTAAPSAPAQNCWVTFCTRFLTIISNTTLHSTGHFEVQLTLEPGILLYLTYKSRKKVGGVNLLILQLHRFCFKEEMFK